MLDEPPIRRETLEQEARRKGLEDAALAHQLSQPSDHWLLRYRTAYLKGHALFIKLQEDTDDLFSRARGVASSTAGLDVGEAGEALTARERRRLKRKKKQATAETAPKASIARRIAVPTVTFVGLLPALATVLHLTFPTMSEAAMAAVVNSFRGSEIEKAHAAVEGRLACSMHTLVTDNAGTSQVFWGPEEGCPLFSDGFGQGELRTASISPAAAERYASIIEVLEGEHRAGRSTILGINLKGLLRALKNRVERMVVEAPRQGGSPPILSAVEVLFGAQVGVSSEQKIEMMEVTALLSAGPLADDAARDQFVTTVLPVAIGASGSKFGPQIAGGMVPVVVFGKRDFSELELFELCVAAAAIKRPIMVVGPATNADGRVKAAERLQYVKARAHSQCLTPLLDQGEIDQNEFDDQLGKLRGWEMQSSLASASVNPTDFQDTLPGLYTLVSDQLRLEPELAMSGELRLHTTSEGQHRLTEAVQVVLDKHAASPDGGTHDLDAMSVAIRHESGSPVIVAAYQNRRDLWFGKIEEIGDEAFRGVPTRSVASTLKGLLVPQFLLSGVTDAICRRAVHGFQDANGYQGDDCSDPAKLRPLETIIGESSNLGTAEAILRSGVDQIGDWLEELGASIQPQPTETLTAVGFTTGSKAVLSPERLARGYVALARGTWGDTPTASDPTLFAGQIGEELDLTQFGISEVDWGRVGTVLEAPMNSSTGTLRKMSQFVRSLGCDLESVVSKSGTSESTFENAQGEQKDVRDRLVVLSAQCDGTAYTVVSIVGTQDIGTPLRSIDAFDVMMLAATTLAVSLDSN